MAWSGRGVKGVRAQGGRARSSKSSIPGFAPAHSFNFPVVLHQYYFCNESCGGLLLYTTMRNGPLMEILSWRAHHASEAEKEGKFIVVLSSLRAKGLPPC